MRNYISRFRRTQRCLRAVGIEVSGTFDQEALGSRLLDRAGLSAEAQRVILIGTQQDLSFERVAEALVLQYPEFRGAPPVVGRDGRAKGDGKGPSSNASSSSSTPASSRSSLASSTRSSMFKKSVYVAETEPHDDGQPDLEAIEEERA